MLAVIDITDVMTFHWRQCLIWIRTKMGRTDCIWENARTFACDPVTNLSWSRPVQFINIIYTARSQCVCVRRNSNQSRGIDINSLSHKIILSGSSREIKRTYHAAKSSQKSLCLRALSLSNFEDRSGPHRDQKATKAFACSFVPLLEELSTMRDGERTSNLIETARTPRALLSNGVLTSFWRKRRFPSSLLALKRHKAENSSRQIATPWCSADDR